MKKLRGIIVPAESDSAESEQIFVMISASFLRDALIKKYIGEHCKTRTKKIRVSKVGFLGRIFLLCDVNDTADFLSNFLCEYLREIEAIFEKNVGTSIRVSDKLVLRK